MEQNGQLISIEMVIVFVFLFTLSVFYNYLYERFQKRTSHYTAEFVVGGVIYTLLAAGHFVGWENVLRILFFFAGAGLPMIIGSWLRAARDDEQAKQIQHKGTIK